MKRILIMTSLLFAFNAYSQSLYFEGGLGMGNIPNAQYRQGKIMLYASLLQDQTDRFHWGLDLTTGGTFITSTNSEFSGGTKILSPLDVSWSSAMLKGRYFFTRSKSPLFGSLGIGINSYHRFVHAVEKRKVSKINLALAPEVGVLLGRRVSLAMRYHVGGNTPSFNGTERPEQGNDPISLASENINIFLLTFGFTLGCN